jgi:rod shape-determining protein MreD
MSLPLAALGALVAALVEMSVLPEIRIAGVKPDLVFVLAVVSVVIVGVEEGLVWAFLGGLMLDLLSVERPLGATMLSLLLTVGIAALFARVLGPSRALAGALAVFALTWIFHGILIGVLAVTAGVGVSTAAFGPVFAIAVLNIVVALPAIAVARGLVLRFAPPERAW